MEKKLLMSLFFVKIDKVVRCYGEVKKKIERKYKEEQIENFIEYFEKNYIKVDEDSLKFWNVYDRVLADAPRTTNILKGFHRTLNNLLVKAHPDIGLLGEELLKENLISNKIILNALYNKRKESKTEEKMND